MADNTNVEVLTIKVGGVDQQIDSLKKLKAAIKDAKDGAIAGDQEQIKNLGKLQDKLEDVGEAARTAKGSGVEKLQSSFSLLFDGFKNFDGGKITTAFKGIGSAMKAIPVLLIAEAFIYLIQNFEDLSKGSGLLAKALRVVGDIITYLTDKVYEFTDAIGLTNSALDKMGEDIVKNADKVKEALDQQTAAFDRQIAVAKAAGKNTIELEKAKQQAIIDTNVTIARQIEAFVRAGGELDDEKSKLLTASLEAIKNAKTQERVITLTDYKQKQDDYKKHLEELNKINEQSEKDIQDAIDRVEAARIKAVLEGNKEAEQRAKDRKEQLGKDLEDQYKSEEDASAGFLELAKKTSEQEKKVSEDKAAAISQIERDSFNGAKALSDAFFQYQANGAKGNEAELKKIAKRKFQVDKAFQVAAATIDGIRAVTTNFAAFPQPYGAIAAAAAAIVAAANVAKISSIQFDGGGASTGSSSSSSGGGSVSAPPPPPQILNQGNSTTTINNNNQSQNGQVYMVETQANEVGRRVARLESQAKF